MDKLKMHSVDKVDDHIVQIATLFPNVVTETLKDGKVVRVVDFDALRQELSDIIVDGPSERYQFTWPDKRKSVLLANSPIAKTLRPCRDESVDFDNTDNLYIEGDNLDALKLLQETYLGKVKMIYIDPPYNTGNDFVYEDDFSQTTDKYLANSGQFDFEGGRLIANLESNGRFHTDWLNMIYPRLKLAKDFLNDDGVIFISADDNEMDNLMKLCCEIFGQCNYIGTFIWEKRKTRENRKIISVKHDYILCFVKNYDFREKAIGLQPMDNDALARYKNPDNDPRGEWTSVQAIAQAGHGTKSQFYQLITPSGRKIDPPSGACWRYTQRKMDEAIADNRIWFGADGNGVPRIKKFLNEGRQGLTPETLISAEDAGTNDSAKKELISLFDGIAVFETPKPTSLVKHLIQICAASQDGLFMDFFSGTATAAHAVIQLNVDDGGHRKFIMVQFPEETSVDSEAYRAGFVNICEIGKERIRRAGKKIKDEAGLLALNLDIGFRVLKVDSTNMQDVYYNPAKYQQMQLNGLADNIKLDRTPEDLLFQVMLDLGILLSSKIEEKVIGDKKVFSVADDYLIACFDSLVTAETVTEIAKVKPYYAVFRDSGMANDSVATNFEQIFTTFSPTTVRKVL